MIVNWSFSIATLNYLRVRMHHVPYIYLYLSQFGWIMPGKMFPLEFGRTVHKNQLFWCQKGLITSCFDSTDSTKIPCPPICLAFHFYQRVPPFSQLKQDSLLSNPVSATLECSTHVARLHPPGVRMVDWLTTPHFCRSIFPFGPHPWSWAVSDLAWLGQACTSRTSRPEMLLRYAHCWGRWQGMKPTDIWGDIVGISWGLHILQNN